MAKQVIGELAAEHSTDRVRKAVQEAVIYEKRSLAYVRRVLLAWQRDGRAAERATASWSDASVPDEQPIPEESAQSHLIWPPPGLNDDLPAKPDQSDPATATWTAICEHLPDLGRLPKMVIPISLIENVLTVSTSDARTYAALTNTQGHILISATQVVLGEEAKIQVEMVERETGAA